jgi:hypothetical protein
MAEFLCVSEVSREAEQQLGIPVSPKAVSDLLYQRRVDVRRCPMLGGRRLVPRDLLPEVIRILRERGVAATPATEE